MNAGPDTFWTPENTEKLRVLLIAAKLSRSQMAAELGATKSMVIAKAHRMGYCKPKAEKRLEESIARKSRNLSERGGDGAVAAKFGRLRAPVVHPLDTWSVEFAPACSWVEESTPDAACWECFQPATQCHWPVRDDPHQFCGAPRVWDTVTNIAASPYCARHRELSTKKGFQQRRQRP